MDTIQLTIDGKQVTGKKGQTILEIARNNNIDIPYLCYHPRISKTGACRICLVRVNDTMLKTSCTEPAANGMRVVTEDDEIRELRRSLLEMLLAEGDHNCLYCESERRMRASEVSATAMKYPSRPAHSRTASGPWIPFPARASAAMKTAASSAAAASRPAGKSR